MTPIEHFMHNAVSRQFTWPHVVAIISHRFTILDESSSREGRFIEVECNGYTYTIRDQVNCKYTITNEGEHIAPLDKQVKRDIKLVAYAWSVGQRTNEQFKQYLRTKGFTIDLHHYEIDYMDIVQTSTGNIYTIDI